jgi:hypothetical protein
MNRHLVLGAAAALGLAACESGDIKIEPSNVDNSNASVNGVCTQNCSVGSGAGGGANNLCASYTQGGTTYQGIYDGTNCVYQSSFISNQRHLLVDMNIPSLASGGAHIFYGSLFVGADYSTTAELDAAGIKQGGDGPTLTIDPGVTVAFATKAQFLTINRGSQLIAVGEPDNPIVFTSLSDVNGKLSSPEAVQQWGGLVINGFGITNKCAYSGTVAGGDLALIGDCAIEAEGSEGDDTSHYGGDNNADSSGDLEYVIVKHTGAEVASGDELNGVSWGAVGSGTIVKNIEAYSVYDDGMEFFGGAVNVENYVAVYARDDSIDLDEGYSGTITNALVLQSATDGNSCIEADGIGSFSSLTAQQVEDIIAQGINSRPTINNLTCIISPNYPGTHDPGAGWHFREGIFPTVNNSILIGSFSANDPTAPDPTHVDSMGNPDPLPPDNYCIEIDNRSQQAADDGDLVLNNVIFACAERTTEQTLPSGATEEDFVNSQNAVFATVPNGTAVDPTAAGGEALQLAVLEGTLPIYSIDWATSQIDGAAPNAKTDPTPRLYLGALSLGATDWTKPWAYGLHPGNRGEKPWIEP